MQTISHPLKGYQECLKQILTIGPTPSNFSPQLAHVWYDYLPILSSFIICVIVHIFVPYKEDKNQHGPFKMRFLYNIEMICDIDQLHLSDEVWSYMFQFGTNRVVRIVLIMECSFFLFLMTLIEFRPCMIVALWNLKLQHFAMVCHRCVE